MNTKLIFRKWYDDNKTDFNKKGEGFVVNAKHARKIIEGLTGQFPDIVRGSSGLIDDVWSIRDKDFKLGDNPARGTENPQNLEAKAEREIVAHCRKHDLCQTAKTALLKSIHSFQVPLYSGRSDSLGEIDLLGTTDKGLPAVIELKCCNKTSRSVGGLLGPIIQGLAYALTIRHYWASSPTCEFKKEWLELEPICDLPKTLEGSKTPIVVAGDSNFWSAPTTWSKCPWSLFVELAESLEEADLPLFAARFESWEKPALEFVRFADLKGCEVGTDPLWPDQRPIRL